MFINRAISIVVWYYEVSECNISKGESELWIEEEEPRENNARELKFLKATKE